MSWENEQQIEAAVAEQVQATQDQGGGIPEGVPLMSPEETALAVFTQHRPKYNALVNKLSANAMRRLLNKLIEYPLNEKPYAATSKEEQAAFYLGFRLLEAKFAAYFTDIAQKVQATHNKATAEAEAVTDGVSNEA